MGKITGFKEYHREVEDYRAVDERILDYQEILIDNHCDEQLQIQGARCMDCGVPFCQSDTGCPIDNLIPEWNDLIYQGRWYEAYLRLVKTNNFPEFTGRVCPAPCEGSCVLGLNDSAVSIKNIEAAIIDKAFDQGWIKPNPPKHRSGKKVAIVGSGPAGLSAADELNKLGHQVVIFERDNRIGGLLMYGIPNMKLDKSLLNRRVDLLREEGIEFVVNADIGKTINFSKLNNDFDVILLATGASKARTLDIKNAQANGVHLAMEYLTHSTKSLLDNEDVNQSNLSAKNKHVIVIGGGDTGTDCIATALRQGAKSITNFEMTLSPPQERSHNNPWPEWPLIHRVEYGHQEAKHLFGTDPRYYCLITKAFITDENNTIVAVKTVHIDPENNFCELANSEQIWPADMVLLAMGFVSPEHYISKQAKIDLDDRQNYQADYGDYQTSRAKVFSAGDCRRGQSLVVWAIHEGRESANRIHQYLIQRSS